MERGGVCECVYVRVCVCGVTWSSPLNWTTNLSCNPVSTSSVPEVETGRHREVSVPFPTNSLVHTVTGREVDLFVSRGASFVYNLGIGGRTRPRPKREVCGRWPDIQFDTSGHVSDTYLRIYRYLSLGLLEKTVMEEIHSPLVVFLNRWYFLKKLQWFPSQL